MANKRKRSSMDHAAVNHAPPAPTDFSQFINHSGEGDISLAEALAQHNAENHDTHDANPQSVTDTANAALHFSMTVPAPTESTFLAQTTSEGADRNSEPNFDLETPTSGHPGPATYPDYGLETSTPQQPPQTPQQPSATPAENSPPGANKPAVGSDEWHKVRRDNHKEVERRRRETINEGINEIAKIVPGCEKNKGSILQRAVQFIQQLKENESQNIEKWTLEKLLTEQAISELSSTCDKLKNEYKNASFENRALRAALKRVGAEMSAEDRAVAEKARDREE